jgi:hypothetical protein
VLALPTSAADHDRDVGIRYVDALVQNARADQGLELSTAKGIEHTIALCSRDVARDGHDQAFAGDGVRSIIVCGEYEDA